MANFSSFSKNIYQKLKQEYSNPSTLILVALLSIPLNYAFNSISLVLLILTTLITFKKDNLKFEINLILPVFLYFLMLLSITWTIDFDRTVDALSKELPLLLIPICFLLFRSLTDLEKDKIIKWYSYGIVTYSIFYLTKAVTRYTISNDSSVFFYHKLVTKDVNAIHVSFYIALSFFYFLVKTQKTTFDKLALGILFLMVFLLSSNNIIVVFMCLLVSYHLFYSKTSKKMRLKNLILLIVILLSLPFVGKIKERIKEEYETIMTDSSVNDVISKDSETVYNVSIKQAWLNSAFKPNDYLPGTAFRVYQFRIFIEFLQEESIFWTGFGLDASYSKIADKGIHYNLFLGDETQEGYQTKNFHNQYVQIFAELGIFGFLLLLSMLFLTIRNAINAKSFIRIAFSVLIISLFFTESFLWRQRGITFFILMYCILNSNIKSEKTITL
jgi:O-antigen ligase